MIRIITNANIVVNAHYIAAFAALRHRVFVERLGWEMPAVGTAKGLEYDRFDTSEAIYIVICNDKDDVIAGVRLLNTSQPCILAECFPDLASGVIPRSDKIWEVTRFVVDPNAVRAHGGAALASQLIWALHSYGLMAGFKGLVSVSYAGMERLLRAAGCRFRRLGLPRTADGRSIVALAFDIDADVVAAIEGRLTQPTAARPRERAPVPTMAIMREAPRLAA